MNLTPKVAASGITGAITIILVWIAKISGLEIPPEVASAFTTVLSFVAAYLAPRAQPIELEITNKKT